MNTVAEIGLNFLFNASWQLIAIAGVALAADRLLRHSARARHFLWVTALLMSLLLPLISSRPASQALSNGGAALVAADDIPLTVAADAEPAFAPKSWTLSAIHVSQPLAIIAAILFGVAIAFRCCRIARAWLHTRRLRRAAAPVDLDGQLLHVFERCEKAFGTA